MLLKYQTLIQHFNSEYRNQLMFNPYYTKPTIRLAHEIVFEDKITKVEGAKSTYTLLDEYGYLITFKATASVRVGDYVIYLNKDTIYHCPIKIFVAGNHLKQIPDGDNI